MEPRLFSRGLPKSSRVALVTVALVAVSMLVSPTAVSADGTVFSGEAYLAKATLTPPLLPPVTIGPIADATLPATGSSVENSALTLSVPNPSDNSTLLSGEVGHVSSIGQGDRSRSEASLASVDLNVAGHSVTAAFLMARAMARCGPSVTGSSELARLVIDGSAINADTPPNYTISFPNDVGSVVINEQRSTVSGGYGKMEVNAVHVIVNGLADVVIAHAEADISCQGPPACTGSDFVTGGGWIDLPSGARGNFAVAGAWKNGSFWGHLLYIDHDNGMKVKGTGVTAYQFVNQTTRHIEGTDDVDGTPGTYGVDVADNYEPGRGADTFYLKLSNGYQAGRELGGGNIQLHRPCQ
jgi:hypothetical protein